MPETPDAPDERQPRRRNPIGRFFRHLVEARWFFAFSASVCATIVGISLTFGINSCRETKRARADMRKSLLQAADNLAERIDNVRQWLEIIENENRLYAEADSIYRLREAIPDSVAEAFYYSVPYVRITALDHEYEKVFRGSYQLWQLQSSNDSLAYYINQCFDGLNVVETTCEALSEGMISEMETINAETGFFRQEPQPWTMTLISNPRFQFFMSIRSLRTAVAASFLEQIMADYDTNVLPRCPE